MLLVPKTPVVRPVSVGQHHLLLVEEGGGLEGREVRHGGADRGGGGAVGGLVLAQVGLPPEALVAHITGELLLGVVHLGRTVRAGRRGGGRSSRRRLLNQVYGLRGRSAA